MTLATVAASHTTAVRAAEPRTTSLSRAFAAGCLLAGAIMAPQAWAVWSRGAFLDPDDAMRAVEARDFLHGQGWFDLVPHRLSPDHPFVMHWSRLVDAPLALSERLFGLVTTADMAERLTRLIEPVALFAITLAVLLTLVRSLAGARAMLPAACLLATSFELMANFLPGHIHHHGAQAMLLIAATGTLLASLGPRGRPGAAAAAGVLAVLSLGIGLQNLPFVVGLGTAAMVAWIAGHRPPCLSGFGLGLCSALPVFLLDVPPSLYGQGACDAFSSAHLAACLGAAAVCLVLPVLSTRLPRWPHRLAAAVAGGASIVAVMALRFPACLGDPMAGVDPLLRDQWLSGVGEALPLARLVGLSPWDGVALALTLLGGLAATVAATLRAAPAERPRWAALLLLCGIGVLGSLWQVRVAASTCALLVPGVAAAVVAVFDQMSRHPSRPALLAAVMLGLFGNGAGWSAMATPLKALTMPPAGGLSRGALAACFEPASLAPLAALPPGLVLSTIDPGSAILAHTRHSVLAAPYHRNTYGNRVSLLSLAATPETARPLIRDARAHYVALCRFSNETAEAVTQHPDSLSAALLAGRIPDWLQPIGDQRGVYLLFAVADPKT